MELPFGIPPGLTLETADVSAGDWVDDRLLPWRGGGEGVRVGEIVPTGFEAYARVLHPAGRGVTADPPRVTWSEVAAEHGKVMHPEVQFQALIDGPPDFRFQERSGYRMPEEGSIPRALCEPLMDVLGRQTRAPDRCRFCLWDGFGFLNGGGVSLVASSGWRGPMQRREMRRDARRRSRRAWSALRDVPRVGIHWSPDRRGAFRTYLMFSGPIEALTSFEFDPGVHFQSPNLWWPEDRAWVVATEIDDWSTYVGGSQGLIEELVGAPGLEVVPSDPDLRFDIRGDHRNAPAHWS